MWKFWIYDEPCNRYTPNFGDVPITKKFGWQTSIAVVSSIISRKSDICKICNFPRSAHQISDSIAPAADENENLDNGDTAKKNDHNPTSDPQAAFRQLTRALLQHGNKCLPGDTNIHKKMNIICRRIKYYMEGNASEKALHRVMHMWKFNYVCKFKYKIKSQWKRHDPPWNHRFPKFGRTYPRFDSVTPDTASNKSARPYKTIRELPNVENAFKGAVEKAAKLFNIRNAFILPFGVMSELLPDKPHAEAIDRLRLQESARSNEPSYSPRRLSVTETADIVNFLGQKEDVNNQKVTRSTDQELFYQVDERKLQVVEEVGLVKAAETLSEVAARVRSFNELCSEWEKDEIAMLKEDFSRPTDREKEKSTSYGAMIVSFFSQTFNRKPVDESQNDTDPRVAVAILYASIILARTKQARDKRDVGPLIAAIENAKTVLQRKSKEFKSTVRLALRVAIAFLIRLRQLQRFEDAIERINSVVDAIRTARERIMAAAKASRFSACAPAAELLHCLCSALLGLSSVVDLQRGILHLCHKVLSYRLLSLAEDSNASSRMQRLADIRTQLQSISRHVFRNASDFKAVWRRRSETCAGDMGVDASDAGAFNGRYTLKTFIAPVQSSLTKQQKLLKWVINNSGREAAPQASWCTPAVDLMSGLTRSFEKLQELLQADEVPGHVQIQRMMSLETLASTKTVAVATPSTDKVTTTHSAYPIRSRLMRKRRQSKVLDNFYQHEKNFPFHPNSCFIKAYQFFWKKHLSHRMTFVEFVCINTFYAPAMVIDLILSVGNIITDPCKCEAKCTCTKENSPGSDATQALLMLSEGNASYYDRSRSDDQRRTDHLNRKGYLRHAAQFPELRIKHQQVWLEAVGILLLEAREFMMKQLYGVNKICVQYLQTPAARARYRIRIKNGRMLDFLGKPFDTSGNSTNSAGEGFAICAWVNDDKKGGFFAHTHTVGQFHHSSFFAGEPVNFAGEIKVTNGRLEVLTQNSGHYKPTEMQLIAMLRFLRTRGFNLSTFECWMYKAEKGHHYEGKQRYSSKLAQDFYDNYCLNFPVYVQLVSDTKCLATAVVDGNSYLPAPSSSNNRDYRRYLEVTSTGYDSYRNDDCDETSSAKGETPALETQPPVGPDQEQIAEDFTQLAVLGKFLEMKEMMSEKSKESGEKSQFVNIQNERQQTALYCAARQGHLEMVKYLLKYEADPNLTEQHGSTPLHAAAFYGHKDCCMALLSWKADASIRNRFDLTALEEMHKFSKETALFTKQNKTEIGLLLEAAQIKE